MLKLRKSPIIPTRRRGGEEISISREKEYLRGPHTHGEAGKRLSQTDLARLLQLEGVPMERDVISRMEMGDRLVTDYEVVTIAEVLGVSVLWILGKE